LNISSVVNASNLYPVVPNKPKGIEKPNAVEDNLVAGKIKDLEKLAKDSVANAAEQVEEVEEVEHYEYEEAPWLKLKFDDPLMERFKKSSYLIDITLESIGKLREINSTFGEFSERLKDLRPDIASSNYGFTLDENANIKILDGRQPLTEADKLWLTDEINKFKNLRNTIHAHSKALMALVDHTKDFGGKYNLNRHNFQSVIDYRDILNTSQHDFYERSLKTVRSYTPMRTEPRISTYA